MGYVGNTKLSVEVNKLAFDLMILLYTESPDSEILINELLVASKNISMSKILKFAQQKKNRRNQKNMIIPIFLGSTRLKIIKTTKTTATQFSVNTS